MVSTPPIVIFGAGGHARECAWIAAEVGFAPAAFVDRAESGAIGTTLAGLPVLDIDEASRRHPGARAVIGIGDPHIRRRTAREVSGFSWAVLRHPSAIVAPGAAIGQGTVLFPGTFVSVEVRIGAHAVLNTGASVSHDCTLEDYVSICPGARLSGGVHVCAGAFVGTGASIRNGAPGRPVRIGAGAVIGAGATVVKNVPDGMTVFGVPARDINARER